MPVDLSIVIVNWNGLAVLRNCLASIYDKPQGISFEVLLVDNASHDESVAVVKRDFPQVKIVQNQENRGFAAANNQAFSIANGRYVLLLNNDTIVLEDALTASVRFMDAEPKIGAMGCRCEFANQAFQTSFYRFNNPFEIFMIRVLPLGSVKNERLNYGRYWGKAFTEPTDVDVVAGCYMVVRREVIASTGGFDEDFFMYGEDEEWCSRIKKAGWRVVYFPGARIIHLHRFSSNQTRRGPRVMECMSPMLVLHKRRGFLAAWLANILLLTGVLFRLPLWLIKDIIHIRKGTAQDGLIQSRFAIIAAQLKGLFYPIWLPRPKKPSGV
jgi:GT2 family glycosyltransferase